jgi:hypothetical protein
MKQFQKIVREYAVVIESLENELGMPVPMSLLPYPKEDIRAALIHPIELTTDDVMKEALKVGLLVLDDFIPDEEVPADEEVRDERRDL